MSRFDRSTSTAGSTDQAATPALRAHWKIGRRGLALARPDLVSNPNDPRPLDLVLDIPAENDARIAATLVDPVDGSRTPIELPAAAARWYLDAEAGLAHIDAGDVLTLTCRWPCHLNGNRTVPHLYAATAATAALGLAGGRYQLTRVDAVAP